MNPSAKASKSEQGGAALLDALTFFMQNICQAVKAVDVQEFEREVKMQLEALSIVVDKYQALDDRAVLEALPMTQYAQVLTVCYENYCEFYGPAKADQLYAHVKRQVKERYPIVDMHRLI